MKDEIKLKDMTDFLENVYKDIKKQPTLKEELEKERKFINKIKGNNEDEIKEILDKIPLNVLEALGNLESGALNYYKATETVKVRYNTILDYITNLQERCEYLESKGE